MGLQSRFNHIRGNGNLYGPRIYSSGVGNMPAEFDQNEIEKYELVNQKLQQTAEVNFSPPAKNMNADYDPTRPPTHQPAHFTPRWSAPTREAQYPIPMNLYTYPSDFDGTYRVKQVEVVQVYVPHDANSTKPDNRYPYDKWAMVGYPTGYNIAPDHGLLRAPQPARSRPPRLFYQIQVRDSGSGVARTYVGARAPTMRDGFNASLTAGGYNLRGTLGLGPANG